MNTRIGLYGLSEPAPPPRPKSRVWKYIKIFLTVAAVFLISLAVLHNAGGNGDTLKKTIETYFSEASGYKATIGKLNAVSFYPLIGVDMEDVRFESPVTRTVVARVGHVNFSTSFWSAASGSSIHTLDVRDATAEAGVVAPGNVVIERFYIDPKDKKIPQLSLRGSYGGKPLAINADMRVIPGLFGSVYFNFAEPSPFELKAGTIHMAGQVITKITGRSLSIEKFFIGEKLRPLQLSLALNAADSGLDISGRVQSDGTGFDYNLNFSGKESRHIIGGDIKGDKLSIDDLVKNAGLFDDYRAIHDFWLVGQAPNAGGMLANTDLDVGLNIAHVVKMDKDLGGVDGRGKAKDGVLAIVPDSQAAQALTAAVHAYDKK